MRERGRVSVAYDPQRIERSREEEESVQHHETDESVPQERSLQQATGKVGKWKPDLHKRSTDWPASTEASGASILARYQIAEGFAPQSEKKKSGSVKAVSSEWRLCSWPPRQPTNLIPALPLCHSHKHGRQRVSARSIPFSASAHLPFYRPYCKRLGEAATCRTGAFHLHPNSLMAQLRCALPTS